MSRPSDLGPHVSLPQSSQGDNSLSLSNLDASFKLEFRAFYLAFVGLVVYTANFRYVSFVIFAACAFYILVSDAIVSVILMSIFLRPILATLNTARGIQSAAQMELLQTRWMTMGVYPSFLCVAIQLQWHFILY